MTSRPTLWPNEHDYSSNNTKHLPMTLDLKPQITNQKQPALHRYYFTARNKFSCSFVIFKPSTFYKKITEEIYLFVDHFMTGCPSYSLRSKGKSFPVTPSMSTPLCLLCGSRGYWSILSLVTGRRDSLVDVCGSRGYLVSRQSCD